MERIKSAYAAGSIDERSGGLHSQIRKIKTSSISNIRKAVIGFIALFFIKKASFNPVRIVLAIWGEDEKNILLRIKKILKCIAEYKSALYVWGRSGIKDFNAYLVCCSRYDTAKHILPDELKLNVIGLEFYEEEKKKGRRIIFIDWHHGHFFLAKNFLFKLDPALVSYGPLECYTRKNNMAVVEQFSNSVQMLARMLKDLDEKKTLHYLFDGVMGVRTKAYKLFDKKVYLPNALAGFIKKMNAVILPINAYLNSEGELHVFIFEGIRLSDNLQGFSDEHIISTFLALFEKNVLSHAPTMVNYPHLSFIENPAVRDSF